MRLAASQISVKRAEQFIVDNASLKVETGELVGLIGPNGAGKSTLLRAIMDLTAHEGDVLIDGQSAANITPREKAKKLAFLPQEGVAEWGISARDVVMLGRHPFQRRFARSDARDQAAVDAALADVEAQDFAQRPANILSGGEKARILLARALAVESPFLLADEPIAALDPYHQLLVMELLRHRTDPQGAAQGSGILLVLHDLSLAMRFCDRVVVMDRGRIIAEGPPDEVLNAELMTKTYGVAPLAGEEAGQKWLMPWRRVL